VNSNDIVDLHLLFKEYRGSLLFALLFAIGTSLSGSARSRLYSLLRWLLFITIAALTIVVFIVAMHASKITQRLAEI
jgi:hypothetical protein